MAASTLSPTPKSPKALKLVGKRFGRLVVAAFAYSKNGKAYWRCQCDCGGFTETASCKLTGRRTKSCGCWRVECLQERAEDLSGKRFGRLVAVERVPGTGRAGRWLCRCDCGRMSKTVTYHLKSGQTRSCGCLQIDTTSALPNSVKVKHYENRYRRVGDEVHVDVVRKRDGVVAGTFRIDAQDEERVRQHQWHICTGPYVLTIHNKQQLKLHWLLGGRCHDHADRDRMNNCRSNLRPATAFENVMNRAKNRRNQQGGVPTSQYKGVWWKQADQRWHAQFRVGRKSVLNARFDTEIEAAQAYAAAVREHCPEFAYTNFPCPASSTSSTAS